MQDGIYEIDLHGLTMAEAKIVLDEVFEYIQGDDEITDLHIVVGVGNGSVTGPILPAYVGNYLTEKGFVSELKNGVLLCKVR